MKKARIVVTLECNRDCENCCNKEGVFNQHKILGNITDVLDYDEIIITGGEPMLIWDRVYNLIVFIRDAGYCGRIYLYSALYNWHLERAYSLILDIIDGLCFTVHNEAKDREIMELKELSESSMLEDNKNKSLRLHIDSRLYDSYDFSNIDFSNWTVVRKLKWLENCPLPENEELFLYQLK